MDLVEAFNQSGWFAKMSLLVAFAPLAAAVAYLVNPAERTLAYMRPLSLTAIFGALSGLAVGVIVVLRSMAESPQPVPPAVYVGFSESVVPVFFNFGLLATSWLLVAAGMLRRRE